MKKLYFLLFFVFSFIVNAQIVNIPDANFKAKLLSANTNNIASTETPDSNGNVTTYNTIDTNGDGEIQMSEAAVIKYLFINGSNISDLTGIESFVNLVSFYCTGTTVTSLNLNQNTALKNIYCGENHLSNLNVNQCLGLEILNCERNQLSSLDVTLNQQLKILSCFENLISNLDVTQNSNLITLWCFDNLLINLDVTQNTILNELNVNNNAINSLDISQNIVLEVLRCGNNQLSNLDVTQNPLLRIFAFNTNQLSSIDLTQNYNLEGLYCYENQLANINLTQNLNLIAFSGRTNQFSNLDFSQNSNLQYLWCNDNELSTLDVTANSSLITLNCMDNTPMETLFMKNNNATAWSTLDFSGNPNLEFVCCDTDDLAAVQQKIIDYGYTACQATNLNCTYPVVNEVSGIIRYDYWDFPNGCDPSDYRVPNVKLEVNDGTSTVITTANQVGSYYIPLGNGNYTITPVIENPDYFNVSPTNFSVDFPTDASPFTQDICLTWNGLAYYDDLEVVILPTTPARPGFEAKYKVIVRNKGFDYTNGTLVFTYDDAVLTYTSSTPTFNSSTTNTLTWNFFSDSFSVLEFDLVFDVNSPTDSPAVNIDDELSFTAVVAHDVYTDYTPDDNTFILDQTVVGSYDPNDKTCLQGETEEVDIVGEYVHYLIRFENTGTYAAEKVVIEDIIDTSKFDVSTLIPIDASHSYYTKITGNVVEFVFDNINLDFNDPNNDGFIAYKIKLLPTLTVGDTFSNSANIYFDSNPAIVTNTYTTTIVNTLSSQTFGNEEFVLYPNPTKDILNISTKNKTEIQSVEIYNIVGQVVIAIPNVTNSIDVSSLEAGTYFIKLNTEKGSTTTKFVKE